MRTPIMPAMCSTCPLRDTGWTEVRGLLIQRTLSEASPICHSTGPDALTEKKAKQDMLCRGARDFALRFFHGIGFLEAATDEAWDRKCAELNIKPNNGRKNKRKAKR